MFSKMKTYLTGALKFWSLSGAYSDFFAKRVLKSTKTAGESETVAGVICSTKVAGDDQNRNQEFRVFLGERLLQLFEGGTVDSKSLARKKKRSSRNRLLGSISVE